MNEPTIKEMLRTVIQKQDEQIVVVNDLKRSHYELRDSVTEMDHTIRGTKAERESGKGGMNRQVQDNTDKIETTNKSIDGINSRQNKILIWGSVIILGLNATAVLVWELIKHRIAGQ